LKGRDGDNPQPAFLFCTNLKNSINDIRAPDQENLII
jgi:hypothetical protein